MRVVRAQALSLDEPSRSRRWGVIWSRCAPTPVPCNFDLDSAQRRFRMLHPDAGQIGDVEAHSGNSSRVFVAVLAQTQLEDASVPYTVASTDHSGLALTFESTEGGVQVKGPVNRASEARVVLDLKTWGSPGYGRCASRGALRPAPPECPPFHSSSASPPADVHHASCPRSPCRGRL